MLEQIRTKELLCVDLALSRSGISTCISGQLRVHHLRQRVLDDDMDCAANQYALTGRMRFYPALCSCEVLVVG